MDEVIETEELDIEVEEALPICLWDEETGDILLPSGFRELDDCPSCQKFNKAAEVIIEEDSIILKYHCDCSNIHGIIHQGKKKKNRYIRFIEEMLTQPEEGEIAPN